MQEGLARDAKGTQLVTHVLILGAGQADTTGLEPLAQEGTVALFRVRR